MKLFVKPMTTAFVALMLGWAPSVGCTTGPPVEIASIAVVSAPGQTAPQRKQLSQLYDRCAADLGVRDRPAPRVVIVIAGRDEAKIADIPGWGHIFIENHPESGQTVYMAWVIGPPRDSDMIEIFVKVLNDKFGIGLTSDQIDATVRRLHSEQTATVTLKSMLEGHKH